MTRGRSSAAVLSAVLALALALPAGAARADEPQPRTDLRVLLVADAYGATDAIAAQLAAEGVPTTTVRLAEPGRPLITDSFLADEVGGVPRAKFQAVVLPNENPFTDAAELTALHAYERRFGVRQVDAYVYPNPAVGQNWPGYSGPLDGAVADVTAAGLAGEFRYLRGPVGFEDVSTAVQETWGALSSPLGPQFTPIVTGTSVDGAHTGVLAGVHTADGRSELVLNFAANPNQRQFRLLAHGIVSWVTGGVYLGYYRNHFAVHIDDVFLPDNRWSVAAKCTPGEDCPAADPGQPPVTTPDIRMTAADVTRLTEWQQEHGFTFDLLYNAGGSVEAIERNGADPLTTELLAQRAKFRWSNHTHDHSFLGCVPDYTVRPWKCTTDAAGAVQYVGQAEITGQILANMLWAQSNGVPIEPDELVTGEHSGLLLSPQQPVDNPHLAPALAAAGVRWIGSDNSRDPGQRPVGPAVTVPRFPMNVFFNVATAAEEVSEYNWIYTSRADGGSGVCEDNPATTTCIAPLDAATGYTDHIVPTEVATAFGHALSGDPRPHYVHQSNFTEERIAYPVIEGVLAEYRAAFADSTPLVNARMSVLGEQLRRDTQWKAALAAGTVSGYRQGGSVVLDAPPGVQVPITLAGDGSWPAFATPSTAYAGQRSTWIPGARARFAVPARGR